MRKKVWIPILLMAFFSACSGGGGGGGSDPGSGDPGGGGGGGGGGGTTPPAVSSTVVLAANDLGMHCMDREFSIFSILPPFNVFNAQVIGHDANGTPVVLNDQSVAVRYAATADSSGSVNSSSIGKTDFWTYANALFPGANLVNGEGLAGFYMPADNPQNPGPQDMSYDGGHGWFSAVGVPVTPQDDAGRTNPYSLMEVTAHNPQDGQQVGSLKVVLPVAAETDCQTCHRNGGIGSSPDGITSPDTDLEVQSKRNILKLHDLNVGTSLQTSTPVLCAECHYSRALDLAGTGPAGAQVGNPVFSKVMHAYHGGLTSGGQPLFPDAISSCYECHPGKVTKCLRGAMFNGGMDCIDCHGGMSAVGGVNNLQAGGSIDGTNDGKPRRPWLDMPRCQSCHTGDAVSHLAGAGLVSDPSGIRLMQAYRTGDNSASPLLATNKRFAEEPNTLYRFSKGHGGVYCENCHGSTHAVWPNANASANDNVTALEIQGYPGKVTECTACHPQGSLPLTINGPHGLHNVNDGRWVDENHGGFYRGNKDNCKACHGTDLLGSPLAEVTTARSFRVEDRGTVTFAEGDVVRCDRCHSRPGL